MATGPREPGTQPDTASGTIALRRNRSRQVIGVEGWAREDADRATPTAGGEAATSASIAPPQRIVIKWRRSAIAASVGTTRAFFLRGWRW
jgi:hypothetical protein